jgi:hypothetical protein
MSSVTKIAAALLLAGLLTACGNTDELKKTKLTQKNLVEVQKKINNSKLTTEEKQSYMLGQIKIMTTGGQVVGKTVGEVMAAGKK